eukprot:485215_1
MGSCVSMQQELDASEKYKDEDSHKPSTPNKTNSELCNVGFLKDEIPNWFPSQNAHKHISSQFTIKEKLGDGITASVYTILYRQTNSICALKRISRDDEFGRMQFTTEAQVLSKISHPSIIKYIDMLMDEKYYYLILEKCDYDLWSLMKKYKYLSETKCKRIIYGLLHGINYIHNKDLVHRDIKPENIVFSNETHVPKLIDFGDAEMAKPNKIYTEFVGTPPYMSPERLGKHNSIELKKSDLWSIGVLAYEMYCHQRCFKGDTQQKVFSNIICGNWNWNSNRMPSAQMKDFVSKCLDLNVDTRLSAQQALQHMWFDDKFITPESKQKIKLISC